ncbi:hypothetical protein HT031_002494 [Scenedesmus sp. PABB004]|nr:hypothetical protein HT031_002494 [Scenedesmus sp. PABB004]
MEALGAAPVLSDGAVGGNCGLLVVRRRLAAGAAAARQRRPSTPRPRAADASAAARGAQDLPGGGEPALFVSRTGKPPGHVLEPSDFVQVEEFDAPAWAAAYRTAPEHPEHRPTSDTPLLAACLGPQGLARHHWSARPRVALHGHALAEGPGLDAARALGLPISERATLFSTREDLEQLEALLAAHPDARLLVRRGHGFFLLARSVDEAAALFEATVVPTLQTAAQAAAPL